MDGRTRVKVCCIASVEEARMAVAVGASAVGLVSAMPSGPGPIPEERIREIAARVPPGVSVFLLTSRTEPAEIAGQAGGSRVHAIQLCDRLGPEARRELRRLLPTVALVQVVHVEDGTAVEEAREAALESDALLLDSGRPAAATKELGGTGRVHDWEVSRRVVASVDLPVFLAGGLGPENVDEAVRRVRPYGVDVCSGLRPDGALDSGRLAAFMAAVRAAD